MSGPAITPQQSGALAGTVVDRLPSKELSGTTSGSQNRRASKIISRRTIDPRLPSKAPEAGTEPLIVKRSAASRRPIACENSPTAKKTPGSSAAPNSPSEPVEASLRWLARSAEPRRPLGRESVRGRAR